MTFTALKRSRQAASNQRRKTKQCASAILRVVDVNQEERRVTVELPGNAAAHLDAPKGPLPMEIRINPKLANRQPNMNDFLGLPGGNSETPMTVEPGSTILSENVQVEDGKVSVGWSVVGTGPRADHSAGGPAEIIEGHLMARTRTVGEEKTTKVSSQVVWPERAWQVQSGDEVRAAVEAALKEDGPGEGFAIVRFSSPKGETLHSYFHRGRSDEGVPEAAKEVAARAADAVLAQMEEARAAAAAAQADGGGEPDEVTVEVIPARNINIGADAQKQLIRAFSERTRGRMNTGAKKFRTAEMHPSDRAVLPTNLKVDVPATASQVGFMEDLADQRGVDLPAAARSTSAAASVWIDENKLVLGFAPGQLVVRSAVQGEDGKTYEIAIASALNTRSGLGISALPTPGCPDAQEFARGAAKVASAARAEIMAGNIPASLAKDEGAPEEEPSAEPDPAPAEEDDDYSGPGFD